MFEVGKYSGFKTENYVEKFIDIKTEDDFQKFLDETGKKKNVFIFGGGTNLLFSRKYYDDNLFGKFSLAGINQVSGNQFLVKGGQNLNIFIQYLNKINIFSLNPLYGLPGTVAGAVVGNAGSFGVEVGQFVKNVKIFDLTEKKFIILNSSELNFKYRWSDLKKRKNLVVYEILFDFSDDVKLDYKPPIEYLKRRLAHQPKGNTCGSFFKNVVDFDPDKIAKKLKNKEDIQLLENFIAKGLIPAGWLIDKAGLKGYDVEGVKVSEKHANFIINYSNKDSQKILDLAKFIKDKVADHFDIMLEEEVVIY